MRFEPLGLKEMFLERALSVTRHFPVLASQSRTILSRELEASFCLSGENATDKTGSSWPSSDSRHFLVLASQSRTVSSSEPETNCCPSGENATDKTVEDGHRFGEAVMAVLDRPSMKGLPWPA